MTPQSASARPGLFAVHWLWGAVALSALLQVAVVHVPPLNSAFGTVPLDATQWLVCIGMASPVLWLGGVPPMSISPRAMPVTSRRRSALTVARERVSALLVWLQTSQSRPVRLVETHISWVLLADTTAYKIKKPVRLPFLDFTTLAARRRYCDEELRLNRRLAPSLYLDAVDVCEGPEGPRFGGVGRVRDVAVRMRRFPDGALWSEKLAAGTLEPRHIDAMAQKLSDFHGAAAVAPPGSAFGSAATHERVTRRLIDAIETWRTEAPSLSVNVDWPALRAWLSAQQPVLAPLWEARRRDGRVRECHGDLTRPDGLVDDGWLR